MSAESDPTAPEAAPAKPAKKKRRARANKRTNKRAKTTAQAEFDGITPSKCPTACSETGCVITNRAYCGHPYKGGLQPPDQLPETMERFQAARRRLAGSQLNLTQG